MVVSYSVKGGWFVAEPPRPWTARTFGDTGVLSNFDFDPIRRARAGAHAGRRRGRQQSPNPVTIRLNAADEVRRRLAGSSSKP